MVFLTTVASFGPAVRAVELALGRWVRYPLGIRCVVSLRKPETAP